MTATRTEINRANAQHSTGPKTPEGKARSSSNSFKHGLYSREIVIRGEDPARFDQLRADLRAEHQPGNTTEEMLVDQLAQHYWRICRLRRLESQVWQPDEPSDDEPASIRQDKIVQWLQSGLLPLIERSLASAERSFHKSLAALRQLQRDRGFVPPKAIASAIPASLPEPVEPPTAKLDTPELGFVPPDESNQIELCGPQESDQAAFVPSGAKAA